MFQVYISILKLKWDCVGRGLIEWHTFKLTAKDYGALPTFLQETDPLKLL